MSYPIIPGAESISVTEGSEGAVLLLHGFMGTVQLVHDWALAFAQAGFAVEAPLLPGHGTSALDLEQTRWADYVVCAEEYYQKLAARYERVFIAGACTGGMLAAWTALNHLDTVAGLMIANGFFILPKHWNIGFVQEMIQTDRRFFPWFGSRTVENPDAPALIVYEQTPTSSFLSIRDGCRDILPRLGEITCPSIVFTSALDKVVPPQYTRQWSDKFSGPVEHVMLERSGHLATFDYDKGIIEDRSIEFARALARSEAA